MSGTERDPNVTALLVRARELSQDAAVMLVGETKLAHEWTDEQCLALAFEVLAMDLVRMLTYAPDMGGTCGWCIRANGDDQEAFDTATIFETTQELVTHTTSCAHNPLVAKLTAMAAARDEACALAERFYGSMFCIEGDRERVDELRKVGSK